MRLPQTDSDASWPTTRYSLLSMAKRHGSDAYRAALERIFRDYWSPGYAYYRRCGRQCEDAKDLIQGFFVQALVDGKVFTGFDRKRGVPFHVWFMSCLMNWMRMERRKARRIPKTFGLSDKDVEGIEERLADSKALDPAKVFERDWGARMVRLAIDAVKEKLRAAHSPDLDVVTQWIDVAEEERQEARAVAATLGITTQRLHKRAFELRRAIVREVALQACRFLPPGTSPRDAVIEVINSLAKRKGPSSRRTAEEEVSRQISHDWGHGEPRE